MAAVCITLNSLQFFDRSRHRLNSLLPLPRDTLYLFGHAPTQVWSPITSMQKIGPLRYELDTIVCMCLITIKTFIDVRVSFLDLCCYWRSTAVFSPLTIKQKRAGFRSIRVLSPGLGLSKSINVCWSAVCRLRVRLLWARLSLRSSTNHSGSSRLHGVPSPVKTSPVWSLLSLHLWYHQTRPIRLAPSDRVAEQPLLAEYVEALAPYREDLLTSRGF